MIGVMVGFGCHRAPEDQLGPATPAPVPVLAVQPATPPKPKTPVRPQLTPLPKPPADLEIWERILPERMDTGSPGISIEINTASPAFSRWHPRIDTIENEYVIRIPGGGDICQPRCHLLIKGKKPKSLRFHEPGVLTESFDFIPENPRSGDLHIYLNKETKPSQLDHLWLVRQGADPISGVSFPTILPEKAWLKFTASSPWTLQAGQTKYKGLAGQINVPLNNEKGRAMRIAVRSKPVITDVAIATSTRFKTQHKPAIKNVVLVVAGGLRFDRIKPFFSDRAKNGTQVTGVYAPTTDIAHNLSQLLGTNAETARQNGFRTILVSCDNHLTDRMTHGFDVVVRKRPLKKKAAYEMTREALRQLQRASDHRVLLVLLLPDPDPPHFTRKEITQRLDTERYKGVLGLHLSAWRVNEIKKGMWRLEARDIKRLNALYDTDVTHMANALQRMLPPKTDTLFALTSTHGYELADHGSIHFGHTLHREATEVPLLVHGPGIPKNRSVRFVSSLDTIFSTLMNLANAGAPQESADKLSNVILGQAPFGPQHAISRLKGHNLAVTYGKWRLISRGLFKQDFYNLDNDPLELTPEKMLPKAVPALLRDLSLLEKDAKAL